jgi:DNA-binding transcriptional regulator YhcF (GntR family)
MVKRKCTLSRDTSYEGWKAIQIQEIRSRTSVQGLPMNESMGKGAPKKVNYIYDHIREVTNLNGLKLDSHHKLILMVMESQGKKIFPSYNTLAHWTCSSVSTVQRKVKDLEKYGIISHIRRKEKSNVYSISKQIIIDEGTIAKKLRKQKSEWID